MSQLLLALSTCLLSGIILISNPLFASPGIKDAMTQMIQSGNGPITSDFIASNENILSALRRMIYKEANSGPVIEIAPSAGQIYINLTEGIIIEISESVFFGADAMPEFDKINIQIIAIDDSASGAVAKTKEIQGYFAAMFGEAASITEHENIGSRGSPQGLKLSERYVGLKKEADIGSMANVLEIAINAVDKKLKEPTSAGVIELPFPVGHEHKLEGTKLLEFKKHLSQLPEGYMWVFEGMVQGGFSVLRPWKDENYRFVLRAVGDPTNYDGPTETVITANSPREALDQINGRSGFDVLTSMNNLPAGLEWVLTAMQETSSMGGLEGLRSKHDFEFTFIVKDTGASCPLLD